MPKVLLALGANLPGPWGSPAETLARAQRELRDAGFLLRRVSRTYTTKPLGLGRQAPYVNAVLKLEVSLAPGAVLRLVKAIERRAGRRVGRHWGPRCLDIDILDVAGRRWGRPTARRERGRLILPHPEMHRRAFVLVPLIEVDRHWRHPILGLPARALLLELGPVCRRSVRPVP